MVGASGFEPPTSWSRTRRSSQAEPRPDGGRPPTTRQRTIQRNIACSTRSTQPHQPPLLPEMLSARGQ
jgi:hypothetical protein